VSAISSSSSTLKNKLLWAAVIVLGTVASGVVALSRGESINAAWLVIAAVCIYFVAYRFLWALHQPRCVAG
jgi:carbon starvation protein